MFSKWKKIKYLSICKSARPMWGNLNYWITNLLRIWPRKFHPPPPFFVFYLKTRSQFRPACKKSERNLEIEVRTPQRLSKSLERPIDRFWLSVEIMVCSAVSEVTLCYPRTQKIMLLSLPILWYLLVSLLLLMLLRLGHVVLNTKH